MLSRLVADGEAEFAPLEWRRDGAAPRRAPERPPAAPGDAADLERKLRHAFESGKQEGEGAARRQLEQQVQEVAGRLVASMEGIAAARTAVLREAEAEVVRLAIEVARRVLHRELSVDPSALEALVRSALEKLRSQEVLRVRLHPSMESLVRGCLRAGGREAAITVVCDPSQPTGGVIFDLPNGSLDATVETQLQEIERGLTDQLGERG